jgi:hypothetical protein
MFASVAADTVGNGSSFGLGENDAPIHRTVRHYILRISAIYPLEVV